MANPQLESFLAMAKGEPALLRQLSACPNLDAIAALGASLGFSFTGVDLVRHQAEATLRLSEEELAAAAAGVELEGHLWLMTIVWG
ncbi:Nif11-like leader peptide family natural product precursor [Synechococcus sp. CBW1004]|jgi:predicted ribosomally synthesized peptide with nif11-like leader|uniref:Nif11-like leader peptide family natural product precursor n=1 Tax=Synechococcus sp. CBW1004 TaxID=1353136 RepID=UPI0018CDE795|nr:Nif11-like leader peptide family natural product precursor [Synechococcus sp. CBW1004]QPN64426.1 Nif11-like leader peptide family natural product precursor [Synechococcus sp. CBW1004]